LALNKKDFLKIAFIILLFLCLVTAWLAFGDSGFIHLYRMDKERQVYQEKIRKLEQANQELLEQISKFRSDKEYIDAEARRELGLVREGELIYRFRQEQNDKKRSGQQEKTPNDE
jgi:cell division protein FtsB